MNVNKFEAAGIGISIALMALALFLVRMEGSIFNAEETVANAEQPSVVVAEGTDQSAALANAIIEASDGTEAVERLIIDDVVIGTGDAVEAGDTVTVHYIGTLQNGQQFDNSYAKGEPFIFTVGDGRVIPGWEQGVIGMQEGGKRILVVPPGLGYGADGYGPIPSNATLVFAVELISIN